jgi:RNA polymerase sigma-70 factor (ECF subfamily)
MKLAFRNARGERAPVGRGPATDEELLRRYRDRGDCHAFEELVRRYEGELFSYLYRYVGDNTLAEDAFQATFLQLHLKCGQFDPRRKVRPWLYTIATNQAIDAQRRNKRHRLVSLDQRNQSGSEDVGSLLELEESDELGPDMALELDESREAAREAVAALPPPLRKAVHLIYYQGLKYREAAEVLSIPVGTVKSRLHTAIRRLAEMFGVEGARTVEDSNEAEDTKDSGR